jgi:acetate---CoA ligase (ADP-forming)
MLQQTERASRMSRRLDSLFSPRSVAVVGASRDPAKWGSLLARGALRGTHRRSVQLVNRNGGAIFGTPAYPSLADLPEAPELVVACVPAAEFEDTVDAALALGTRAIIGISAGLERARERAVSDRVRAAGAMLLGPNCLGVFDRDAELDLAPWVDFPAGDIGLIAQSGNLSLELALLAERHGLGFSRFVSLGNQADLEAAELLECFADHDGTRLIALYVEDFRDGRALARAARDAIAAGKHIVLLAVGESEAGVRAARSHTGALVSDFAVVDVVCRAAGIVRVSTPRELIDAAEALLHGRVPRGRRLVVVCDGGGHGVVAADVAERAGLRLPVLSERLAGDLEALLPTTAETQNPVDFSGGAEQDIESFARVGRLVVESGEADALLVTGYFGGYHSAEERKVAAALAQVAAAADIPLVVHTLYPDSEAASVLREDGALVYREIEIAVGALALLASAADHAAGDIPDVQADSLARVDEGYFPARALAASAGIPMAAAREVRTLDDAIVAAEALGYPVVLKALGREHKSDAGGVVLGIADERALETAVRRVERELAPASLSVERMAPLGDGIELIVGTRRDPRFGPLLMIGLGGIHAEVFNDIAVALAPVEPPEAEALLRSLRCSGLLKGARGRPALDVGAAAQAASALSHLAARASWISEVELNPLLVLREGVLGLDARLVGTIQER